METVLITGASGLIGTRLTELLISKNYHVIHLSRTKNDAIETYTWNINEQKIDDRAIEKADYIIHLAGTGIADKRWTKERKQEIIDSRIKSSELLFESIKRINKKLKGFVSASAIGFYGAITSEKIFSEEDIAATDFLGSTCEQWEKSVTPISNLGIRTVKIRIGIVLAKNGGALKKMATPINYFIGSSLGSGKQFVPWIHIDDLCAIFLKAIEDEQMNGVFNAVAPEHITNKELTKAIAHTLHKPLFLANLPGFILKIIFRELSNTFLKGSRVSSKKITTTGFVFKFKTINDALKNIFEK